MKSKRCSVCNTRKSIDQYTANPAKPDGHRAACRECRREKRLRLRNKDELHTYKHFCRNAVRRVKKGYTEHSKSFDLLGASTKHLHMHLNSFLPKGKDFRDEDVHIDHFFPLGAAQTQQHLRLLSHYTNLRALPAHLDDKKGNNMPYHICSETGAVIPFLEEDMEYILKNFESLEHIRKIITGETHGAINQHPHEEIIVQSAESNNAGWCNSIIRAVRTKFGW